MARFIPTSLQLPHVMLGSRSMGESSAPFQVPVIVCRDPPPVLCPTISRLCTLTGLTHRHTGASPGLVSIVLPIICNTLPGVGPNVL